MLYLDLLLVSCCDVGDCPTSFLLDTLLVIVREECQEAW